MFGDLSWSGLTVENPQALTWSYSTWPRVSTSMPYFSARSPCTGAPRTRTDRSSIGRGSSQS
eukprot:3938627-Rhodomonas_salina.5